MKIFYKYHSNKYQSMQVNDQIKLIYQATLGPNHLGKNLQPEMVFKRITEELQEPHNVIDNIYEWISFDFIRVNICEYHKYFNIGELVNNFILSSQKIPYNIEVLKQELRKYLQEDDLKDYNYEPISHTIGYKGLYFPHYLVIHKDYLTIDMRRKNLNGFLKTTAIHTITSLEGKCTSGKTTLSQNLDDLTVIHIDDFFLPEERKRPSRMLEIGGNIDYELTRVNLLKIKNAWNQGVCQVVLKKFSCTDNCYYEEEVVLKDKVLLEGVYSYHPYFQDLIDYLAYVVVDEETQYARVSQRRMKERFINEWIPLENRYFDYYCLEEKCDILI